MIFINVLENITLHCDCLNQKQTIFTDNIGILYSNDPVAIDKASLDLINKQSQGKFHELQKTDNSLQINYAQEKGLGNKEYSLIYL